MFTFKKSYYLRKVGVYKFTALNEHNIMWSEIDLENINERYVE